MKRLLLFLCMSMQAMEQPKPDISEKSLLYFLGRSSPQLAENCGPLIKKKLEDANVSEEDIHKLIQLLDPHPKLSDSQEIDKKLQELKKFIAESVEEVLKKKDEDITDGQLQLKISEQELRKQKYKLYGMMITLGGTAVTSIVTIITLLTAN